MTLDSKSGAAGIASRGLVASNPFVVFEGRADASFEVSEKRVSVHASLYLSGLALMKYGICTYAYVDGLVLMVERTGRGPGYVWNGVKEWGEKRGV